MWKLVTEYVVGHACENVFCPAADARLSPAAAGLNVLVLWQHIVRVRVRDVAGERQTM